jgi:hypothetical protein
VEVVTPLFPRKEDEPGLEPLEEETAPLLIRWVEPTVLLPEPPNVRVPLNILLSLLGTPVEIKPLLFDTPMPAKVLPLNLATGSIRKTLLALTSLK